MEKEIKKVQCKYCKELIDSKASVCPYCRKRQRGSGCSITILIFIVIIFGIAIAKINFGTEDLEIINDSGKHNELGMSYWEGDLVNKSNSGIDYIIITYNCYNDSKESMGVLKTKIKHIDGKETIHFQAVGIVKKADTAKCESNITRVTEDEFNKD